MSEARSSAFATGATSSAGPRVSVIVATWNRSRVLELALRSALRSTYRDFEVVVVGDCCTDDTEVVVSRFDDPRIRFVNLERNAGEQSVPNNSGLGLARGELIAYLNHDDLWYADHLESLVEDMDREPADLLFSMLEVIEADGTPTLSGVTPTGRYEPSVYVPASSWLATRSFLKAMGGWRPARQTFLAPSQDLLFRAWKEKRTMRLVPRVTGVGIPSGGRAGSYVNDDASEHASWFERMCEPGFRERELMRVARVAVEHQTDLRVGPKLRRAAENAFRKACLAIGVHPGAVRNMVRFGRRGGFIRHLRRVRGLGPAGTGERADA